MISFIVCKWRDEIFTKMALPSIERQLKSCGGELIVVHSKTSIFAAYEIGRQQAKYDIIAYVHEDVAFVDLDLAERVLHLFKTLPELGLLGVVGSAEAYYVPWWENKTMCGHFLSPVRTPPPSASASDIGHRQSYDIGYTYAQDDGGFAYKKLCVSDNDYTHAIEHIENHWQRVQKVSFIDGLFMAERRNNIAWDTTTFSGWHCYDLDRCLQVINSGRQVYVGDLLVLHDMQHHSYTWHMNHLHNLWRLRHKWGCRRRIIPSLYKKKMRQIANLVVGAR